MEEMMSRFYGCALISMAIVVLFCGATISTAANSVNIGQFAGQIEVNSTGSDYSRIGLEVNLGKFDWTEVQVGGDNYAQLSLPDCGFTTEIGKAKLPVIRKLVQIPFGADVSIDIKLMKSNTYSLSKLGIDMPLYPVQEPVSKEKLRTVPEKLIVDDEFYRADAFYQNNPVKLVEINVMRGYRFATVDIYPISYNPASGVIRVIEDLEFELALPGSNPSETESILRRYYSPDFEEIARNSFINYGELLTDYPTIPVGMIVIVSNSLWGNANIDTFVTWKRQKGFNVDVQRAGDLGGNTTGIKNYIQTQYDNGGIPVTYVLLIGDTDGIPTWTGSAGSHSTDQKYVQLAGGDYFPDAEIGRFPAQSTTHLANIVDKAVDYEQTWGLNGTGWMNSACFIASDDSWYWSVAEATHRYVIQTYMAPRGIACDSVWGHSGGSTSNIRDALNAGRMICNYSGHGSTTSWGGPAFGQSNVNALTNSGMYPLVFSNACVTGSFSQSECFMETWVRAPQKGAFAAVGASNNTYWDEDDWWERAAFDGFFLYGSYTVFGMDYRGNMSVYSHGSGMAQYYFEVYNVMGDPSTMPWIGTPRNLAITHDSQIQTGQTSFTVNCNSGTPVANVLVALYMDGTLYGAAYSNSSGVATITLDPPPSNQGTMYITCTSLRYVPVQHTVPVVGGGPLLDLTLVADSTQLHRGGQLSYNVSLVNNGNATVYADCWTAMRLPSGSIFGPMLGPINNVPLVAGASVAGHFGHSIPFYAPTGNYVYFAYSGEYPAAIWAADSFAFTIISKANDFEPKMSRNWDIVESSGGFELYLPDLNVVIPQSLELIQNYPNPFNPSTSIKFGLDQDSQIRLNIYNLRGELVKTIADGFYPAGWHQLTWDATDMGGVSVSSGIYFYKLDDGQRTLKRIMSLIR